MPPPIAGHDQRFYAVIAPPGIDNSIRGFVGQHQSFQYKGGNSILRLGRQQCSLTGHNCVTKVFSHELVEACTNPNVDTSSDGILVDGDGIANDEIGDTCNDQFATVNMNGVQCSVQSYWSKCILPT